VFQRFRPIVALRHELCSNAKARKVVIDMFYVFIGIVYGVLWMAVTGGGATRKA
jgi:hypothetical protein